MWATLRIVACLFVAAFLALLAFVTFFAVHEETTTLTDPSSTHFCIDGFVFHFFMVLYIGGGWLLWVICRCCCHWRLPRIFPVVFLALAAVWSYSFLLYHSSWNHHHAALAKYRMHLDPLLDEYARWHGEYPNSLEQLGRSLERIPAPIPRLLLVSRNFGRPHVRYSASNGSADRFSSGDVYGLHHEFPNQSPWSCGVTWRGQVDSIYSVLLLQRMIERAAAGLRSPGCNSMTQSCIQSTPTHSSCMNSCC